MTLTKFFPPALAVLTLLASWLSAKEFYESQTISRFDAGPWDDLGYSLAADNTTIIAGAINVHAGDRDVGSAFVYQQADNQRWGVVGVLVADDPQTHSGFGHAVGVSGNHAIVGAPRFNELRDTYGTNELRSERVGAAYIFTESNMTNEWQLAARLSPPSLSVRDFGDAVSISRGTAAISGRSRELIPPPEGIGAPSFNETEHIFIYREATPGNWSLESTISSNANSFKGFARSLKIDGDTLVATSPWTWDVSPINKTVHVYKRAGADWNQVATVTPDVPYAGYLGDVDIKDGHIIMSIFTGDGRFSGDNTSHILIYDEGSPDVWKQTAAFTVPHYARSVSIFGDLALAGAYDTTGVVPQSEGVTNVFRRNEKGVWRRSDVLQSPTACGIFGWSTASVEGNIVVGTGVNAPGSLHIYYPVPEPAGVIVAAFLMCGFRLASSSRIDRRRFLNTF